MPEDSSSPPLPQIVISATNPITSQIVNAVVKNRPLGWSQRSQATYYKERNAKWLQHDIDLMMVDRKARLYRYSTFSGMSRNSLYLKINQSFRFLLDNLDPDGIYKDFADSIRITRQPNVGVLIKFEEHSDCESIEGEALESITQRPKWMEKMDAWLESEETKPFIKEGLCLSDEEVAQVKLELSGLTNVMASVDNGCIKIMKL